MPYSGNITVFVRNREITLGVEHIHVREEFWPDGPNGKVWDCPIDQIIWQAVANVGKVLYRGDGGTDVTHFSRASVERGFLEPYLDAARAELAKRDDERREKAA